MSKPHRYQYESAACERAVAMVIEDGKTCKEASEVTGVPASAIPSLVGAEKRRVRAQLGMVPKPPKQKAPGTGTAGAAGAPPHGVRTGHPPLPNVGASPNGTPQRPALAPAPPTHGSRMGRLQEYLDSPLFEVFFAESYEVQTAVRTLHEVAEHDRAVFMGLE